MPDNISRKEFLQRISVFGVSAIGAGSFLTYCGSEKKSEPDQSQTSSETTQRG